MVDILVVIDIALQRAVGGNPLTKEDGVHDGLTVDSITDSRDQISVVLPVFVFKIEEDAPVIGSLHVIAGKTAFLSESLRVFRRQESHIQFTGAQLHRFRIVVRYDLEDDIFDIRHSFEIVFISDESDRLAFLPAGQTVRAGAHRMTKKVEKSACPLPSAGVPGEPA